MDGLRAADLLQLLQERFVLLTGGRDQRGGPILSFPATPRRDRAKPDDIRRLLTYLFTLPRYEQKMIQFFTPKNFRHFFTINLNQFLSIFFSFF